MTASRSLTRPRPSARPPVGGAARRPLVAAVAAVAAVAGALAGACGGDTTEPGEGPPPATARPGIEFVAGATITDTVDAQLPLALRIVVRDARGAPMPGVVVRFTSVPRSITGGDVPTVLVGGIASARVSGFVAETTSAAGVASVRVVLGWLAGPGGVAVSVPDAGFADTARYTIRPGNARTAALPTVDTTMTVGGPLQLTAAVRDRWGNARDDALAFRSTDPGVSVDGTGRVAATVPARAAVIATLPGAGTVSDTTWVSAVPPGTIVVRRGGKLLVGPLDGSAFREVPLSMTVEDPDPEWSPSGETLVARLRADFNAPPLYELTPAGATRLLAAPTVPVDTGFSPFNTLGAALSFAYAPDGRAVYVSASNCTGNGVVYRVPVAAPSTPVRVSPPHPRGTVGDCFDTVHRWPSPSPDGRSVAIEYYPSTVEYVSPSLRRIDVATGTITSLGVTGNRPRWSPAGDMIAYGADGRVWVVRPDGSGARPVSPAGRVYTGWVNWSPDGRWLIGRAVPAVQTAGPLVGVLLDVTTGQEIPLPYLTGYDTSSLPVWRPAR